MPWGVAAAAVASYAGSSMQAGAAEDAAKAQADAASEASFIQQEQNAQNRRDLEPWRRRGGQAVEQLGFLMGLGDPTERERDKVALAAGLKKPTWEEAAAEHLKSHIQTFGRGYGAGSDAGAKQQQTQEIYDRMLAQYEEERAKLPVQPTAEVPAEFGALTRRYTLEDFESDPVIKKSFEFGLSEGEKAVRRMFGSRGLSRSGAAVKAASRFATDYTGSKAGESRQRFVEDQNNLFNRLSGVAGTGQAATTATAGMSSQISNNISDIAIGTGNARGAAAIAGGNAAAGGLTSAGNAINSYFTMDRILNSRPNTNPNYTMSTFTPTYTGYDVAGGAAYG